MFEGDPALPSEVRVPVDSRVVLYKQNGSIRHVSTGLYNPGVHTISMKRYQSIRAFSLS
jgi:hypothetical protein